LVKAVYRLAQPMDFLLIAEEEAARDTTRRRPDINAFAKAIMTPLVGQISAIEVEYGLYKARFWLPRMRTASGQTTANFIHVPFTMQQTFQYASVNETDSLPPIVVTDTAELPRLDSVSRKERRRLLDSVRTDRDKRWT